MEYGARPLRSTRRLANSTGTRPRWWRVANQAATGPTQVHIYDEIGMFGVGAADFLADMQAIKGDVELHINSPGGDVFDGISIYNQLRQRAGNVSVVIDGLAASAASFIAMAASPGLLEIAPHAEMMIHDGFAMGIGNASDLRGLADQLDRVSDNIASIYADRTGKPADHWRGLMQAETWFSDKEAVDAGLADRIHGQAEPEVSNEWDLSVFARYAAGTLVKNVVMTPLNADGTHEPITGEHQHAHTAGGDQGDDAMHEHAHTHDNDADHGHDHDPDNDGDDDTSAAGDTDHDYVKPDGSPGPKAKAEPAVSDSRFPILDADVDNSPWDASTAWHNGATADDPAAFYRGICAGRRSGDPDTQNAWALPYKYHPSDPPNAAGVRAALARLSSTEGLTNESQAKATLERAMKAINPDYEPDDEIDTALLAAAFSLGLEGSRT